MRITALIVCLPLCAFGAATAQGLLLQRAGSQAENRPVIPKASKGDQCVADTEIMRKDHMSLLNHQRDETVIEGIRSEPYSLVSCVNCHAQTDTSGQAIRIDAEGQFCESCHSYAAVKIDCFTCHAAKPAAMEVIGNAEPHLMRDNPHTLVSYLLNKEANE